ncbi:hypothetical protein ACH5RR_013261 [Cinchona calisaya]|uniref:Uncharacterized protein n=1 Tax=Cinchona calisaya TaxID=153742 RepID=A0ABD2ZZL3_9GENT
MVSDDLNETSNTEIGCEGGVYDCENWLVEISGVKILGKCRVGEVGICGVKKWGSSRASEEGVHRVSICGVSKEGVRGVGIGGVSEEGNNLVKQGIKFSLDIIRGSLLSGGPLNSNLPINPHEPSDESFTAQLNETTHRRGALRWIFFGTKGCPPLDILWKSTFPDRPPPAWAPTSKLQFHLSRSSTRLTGMPPLHPQPHQLKIGQPKVVHETGSKNEDKSENRLEAETDDEVEDETEEEVEGETEEDVEHESEDVIPIPYKKWSN